MVDLVALRLVVAQAMVSGPDGTASPASAVCEVCVRALPADGAAFTAMASDQARELLYASDAVIRQVHELQFSLGEGPCLEAFEAGRPVLITDVAELEIIRWPVLAPALADLPVAGLFTFPLVVGAITIGVAQLYRRAPGRLSREDVATILQITDLAGAALLALRAGYLANGDGHGAWLDGNGSDRRVHQATGMLIAALSVPAEEAFARLRGYAFAHDLRIGAVAEDIVARRLTLEAEPN